jgi:hypothetical protein
METPKYRRIWSPAHSFIQASGQAYASLPNSPAATLHRLRQCPCIAAPELPSQCPASLTSQKHISASCRTKALRINSSATSARTPDQRPPPPAALWAHIQAAPSLWVPALPGHSPNSAVACPSRATAPVPLWPYVAIIQNLPEYKTCRALLSRSLWDVSSTGPAWLLRERCTHRVALTAPCRVSGLGLPLVPWQEILQRLPAANHLDAFFPLLV